MTGRVIHLFPRDLARGAQVYARALCDALQAGGEDHRAMTVFASRPAALRAEHSLGARPGRWTVGAVEPGVAVRLRRALRALGPDAVVAHGGEAYSYAALARPRGARLIYLRIGLSGGRVRGRLRLRLWRELVSRADAVVAVSEETALETEALFGAARDRVHVIPNGRDPLQYRPAGTRPAHPVPRLVWIGSLDRDKRPELFLATVRNLRERGVDAEAVVVGDGPLSSTLRPIAEMAGATMLGLRDDVPAILAGCDALVFTATAVLEGMPGVLIEAGLAGLPAVTTEVAGAAAIVEDGVTGFVVPVDDEAALASRTSQLAADPELRRSMGAAARARCLELFTIEASARRWRCLLDELLSA